MEWAVTGKEGRGRKKSRVDITVKPGTIWPCQNLGQVRASCMQGEFMDMIQVPTLPTLCSILGWTV